MKTRSRAAFDDVMNVRNQQGKLFAGYFELVNDLPFSLMRAGLGNVVAAYLTVIAKGKGDSSERAIVLKQLWGRLFEVRNSLGLNITTRPVAREDTKLTDASDDTNFAHAFLDVILCWDSSRTWRAVGEETLAYAGELRRYGKALQETVAPKAPGQSR